MIRFCLLIMFLLAATMIFIITGCAGHRLTGYNVKTSVGQTAYDDGRSSLFTGASADFHFDVK